MKFLQKVNRGLILTLLVLAVVVAYSVSISVSHASEKPEIRNICKKYIATAVDYKMVPEKYRSEKLEMPQGELDKYIADMSRDIKAFYSDNEQTYKYMLASYKASLQDQAKGKDVIYSYKKDITDFKKFIFDGKTVTVTILTNSVYDGPNVFQPGTARESIAAQTTDVITLQQINGKWKIVYAYLQQPVKNEYNNGMVYQSY